MSCAEVRIVNELYNMLKKFLPHVLIDLVTDFVIVCKSCVATRTKVVKYLTSNPCVLTDSEDYYYSRVTFSLNPTYDKIKLVNRTTLIDDMEKKYIIEHMMFPLESFVCAINHRLSITDMLCGDKPIINPDNINDPLRHRNIRYDQIRQNSYNGLGHICAEFRHIINGVVYEKHILNESELLDSDDDNRYEVPCKPMHPFSDAPDPADHQPSLRKL